MVDSEHPDNRTVPPLRTRAALDSDKLLSDQGQLTYQASDVTAVHVTGLSPQASDAGNLGTFDLAVSVSVVRSTPRHESRITVTERRNFRFAPDNPSFQGSGPVLQVFRNATALSILEGQ